MSKSLISHRFFEGKKSTILTIPKGTVLFRVVKNPDNHLFDFLGKYDKETDTYTLSPDQNTFFYFYPYVFDTNKYLPLEIPEGKTPKMITYITTKDVNVLILVKPSEYTKSKRSRANSIISCKDILTCDGEAGMKEDLCFNPRFKEQNPDVIGKINLKYGDNLDLKKAIESGDFDDFQKFIAFFRDADFDSGIFELSLYPRITHKNECINTKLNLPGYDWINKHLNEFNYFPFNVHTHKIYEKGKFYDFLEDSFKPSGYKELETEKVYHLTIDKRTYFYVLVEAASADTLKHCENIDNDDKLEILRKRNPELIFDYAFKIYFNN
jgi:hypothetical protein